MKEKKNDFAFRKIRQIGRWFGYQLVDAAHPAKLFHELLKYRDGGEEIGKSIEHDFLTYILRHYGESKAQLCQDLMVLFLTESKRNGFFVEFGATNGVTLSNSYLLEKGFGWNGILAEPAHSWHGDLMRNRQCIIETRCVWRNSGERLEFNEVAEGELSTINAFSSTDGHEGARKQSNMYMVDTISLNDLLDQNGAPHQIDYLSVDTEGSEFTILSHFDFSKYDIRIISVEHNFTPEREKLFTMLQTNGYRRIFEGYSRWDDWYIKA